MNKYLTEFIGTFFLVFTIGMAAGDLAPLAIGGVLTVMVYMGGHVSGAHYNPAVTLAIWMRGRLPSAQIVPYMIAQILGALAASAVVFLVIDKTFGPAPREASGTGIFLALLVEILFTFALALVILNVATSKDHPGNSFYGLAIGFTVMAGAFSVDRISGAAFNPAVGVGPLLIDAVFRTGTKLPDIWIYLVGPFAGAALAAFAFKIQNPGDV